MDQIRFTGNHEWIKMEGNLGVVGVTDYAQDEMSDVTFVEVPNVGLPLEQGEYVCVVETVKTSVEICAPINGEIAEVNTVLGEHPELINGDPMGDGWIFKLKAVSKEQFKKLMDSLEYETFLSHDADKAEEKSLAHISLEDVDVDVDEDAGQIY
jgi:glycine cleavage system H protein